MEDRLIKAEASDKEWIKAIYKQEAEHLGPFNLFWSWDKYLTGESPYKYICIRGKGFVRYGYSKKYDMYVIQEIGVDAEYKRQGLAKKLLQGTIKVARRNSKFLMLKCNIDNEVGNKFYEACGMRIYGTTKTKKGVKQNIWLI